MIAGRGVQVTIGTDQNGTLHGYVYDLLGRLTQDCITTLGAGVDGTIRRISTQYEVRGMATEATSYDNPTVGSGNVINDVQLQKMRAKAKSEGLWSVQMPKERGGQGLSFVGMAACYEEMNRSIFGPVCSAFPRRANPNTTPPRCSGAACT